MSLKTAIQITIGLVGYIAWAVMVFLDPTLRPDFLHFNIAMAMGTIGLVLRDMQPSTPKPPVDTQAGRAQVGMLATLAAAMALLAGCADFQQALTGYESAAYAGAKASNDNIIQVWKVAACATPFSAAVRNPEIIPALKALCLPAGAGASPITLLDAVPAAPAK